MASAGINPTTQFNRILERLNAYTGGNISLRVLIADLEVLVEMLAPAEKDLYREFREYWAVLEEVYSAQVVNPAQEVDSSLESQIKETTIVMRQRIEELLVMSLPDSGDDGQLE